MEKNMTTSGSLRVGQLRVLEKPQYRVETERGILYIYIYICIGPSRDIQEYRCTRK